MGNKKPSSKSEICVLEHDAAQKKRGKSIVTETVRELLGHAEEQESYSHYR